MDQSWLIAILPSIGEESLHDQIKRDKPWNTDGNEAVTSSTIPSYRCPSTVKLFDGQGDYAGIRGSALEVDGAGTELLDDTYKWERYVDVTGPPIETAIQFSRYGAGVLIMTDASD